MLDDINKSRSESEIDQKVQNIEYIILRASSLIYFKARVNITNIV